MSILTKSYSLQGSDGAILRIEETPERLEIVVSISRHDNGKSNIETVRLNKEQFDAYGELFGKYSSSRLECNYPPDEEKPEAAC